MNNTSSVSESAMERKRSLSAEHRQYLISRHGTLNLEPLPSSNPSDPYNWPQWQKIVNLILVAFHAMLSTFTAASIIPAYELIADDLSISVQRASYLTSLQICLLGFAPLLWCPLADRYGRKPIFLLSLLVSLAGNVGCARSHSYAAMAACRAIVAFFISPAAAIGTAVVKETFFKRHRGRYIGIWALCVTVGIPLAPFIMGFVAFRANYRWIYYILAIINSVQLLLYTFLGGETRFVDNPEHQKRILHMFHYGRIDPQPLTFKDFLRPFKFAAYASVLVPAIAYAMVFVFSNVMLTVEIPQLFARKFSLNAQQLGLQFVGIIIGSLLGELVGGPLSDVWMNRWPDMEPKSRLWLSYFGYLLAICGVAVFLVRIDQAPEAHWNVTPLIGAAIAAGGNQIVTTVLLTFSVDCFPGDAASVGVFVTMIRQTWGFIGPFWFPEMFRDVGIRKSAIVASVLMFTASLLPTIVLHNRAQPRHSRV